MDRRLSFQAILEALSPGMKVYFQEPEDVKMVYPCIVYSHDPGSTKFANNLPYNYEQQYQVELISYEPQPVLFHKLAALPKSIHARSFVANNLNHGVFSIYF